MGYQWGYQANKHRITVKISLPKKKEIFKIFMNFLMSHLVRLFQKVIFKNWQINIESKSLKITVSKLTSPKTPKVLLQDLPNKVNHI